MENIVVTGGDVSTTTAVPVTVTDKYILSIPMSLKDEYVTKCCLFIIQFIYLDIPINILYVK